MQRVRGQLRSRFNLRAGSFSLCLPPLAGQSRRSQAKDFLQKLREQLFPQGKECTRYILTNIRIVESSERTAATKHTNAQKLAREGRIDKLRALPGQLIRSLLVGEDSEVSDETWDVPLVDSEKGAEKRWERIADTLSDHFSLSPNTRETCRNAANAVQKKDQFPKFSQAYN